MTTFSQLVDTIVSESRRPDMVAEIATYINQTIRELHFDQESNKILFFNDNFREDQLTAGSESGFSWTIPNPAVFQKLKVVAYATRVDYEGKPLYPQRTTPGRHLNKLSAYYYQAGEKFFFNDYGGLNAKINLGWFEFPRRLVYQVDGRLVTWDEVEQVFDYDPSLTTDELKEAALAQVTNWILTRHEDVVAEGARAKVYKRVSDTERARTSYSMYMSLRGGFWSNEVAFTESYQ